MIKGILKAIILRNNPIKFWKKNGAKIGTGCYIHGTAELGSEPFLITIGDHVRVNRGVSFITHDGGTWVLRGLDEKFKNADLFGKIKIGNNGHIGTDAVIMPGVTIGDNCIIGCRAVVTKDIPDNSIVVGVPARVIKTIQDYEEQHKEDFDYTKHLSFEEKKKYLIEKYNK